MALALERCSHCSTALAELRLLPRSQSFRAMQHVRIARQHCDHRKLSAKIFGDGLISRARVFSRPASSTGSADRVLSTCCSILLAIFACAEHCATTMFV